MEVDSTLRERLETANQEHLLAYWSELNDKQRETLLHDINEIDLNRIVEGFNSIKDELVSNSNQNNFDDLMEPVPDDVIGSIDEASVEQLENYKQKGLKAISEGSACVLLLAGGQGTRLGVSYPKGMYNVGLPSQKVLYQIQAERILRLEKLANEANSTSTSNLPWFIMTSEHTQEQTEKYFHEHNYFGLKPSNVIFFEQHVLPALDFQGKILLDEKYKLTKAADGNGGLYRALKTRGILDEMTKRGIKYIHVYCVDNILVRLADPIFIGFCIDKNADCAGKVVEKAFPTEAVGVICKIHNRYQVVEYSEISEQTAQRKRSDTNDELLFNAGNICNHFFTLDFVKDVCHNHEQELRYHVAKKKVPSIGIDGKRVDKPNAANGIKLEKFVFDVFPFSKRFAVWNVCREDEFSPLKNATGAKDTAETCRKDLLAQHKRYVQQAGAVLPGTDEFVCEISPLVSYSGENLEFLKGQTLNSPTIIELNTNTKKPEINS